MSEDAHHSGPQDEGAKTHSHALTLASITHEQWKRIWERVGRDMAEYDKRARRAQRIAKEEAATMYLC